MTCDSQKMILPNSYALGCALALTALVGFANSAVREIRVQLPSEPVTLDPAGADDDLAARILGNTMDGLVGYDRDGKLENRLAQSYSLSPDRRTYTFTLRKGAQWSDGRAVTAEDFVLGIRRSLDPKTGSKIANLLFPIRGAREFNAGKGSIHAVGVTADAGGKLVITLLRPAPYFIQVLALSQAAPTRSDILAANAGKWPENGPVTGPYVLDSHVLEQELHLSPNPRCWRFNKKSLPVSFKIIPEESTAQALFDVGKLDVVTRVAPSDYGRYKAKGMAYAFPQAATYYFSFSTKKPPFNNRDLRRAVAGVVNRGEMHAALTSPARVADGWIPPEIFGERHYKLDPKVFGAAVQASAVKLKGQPLSATGAFNMNAMNSTVMEKLQFDLLRVLGLTLELTSMDWKSYIALIRSDTPQLYRFQRGAPFMDPIWHLSSFRSDDANNPTGWKNAEYDRLVEQVASMPMGEARQTVIEKAEKILIEDEAIVVPLFFANQVYLIADRIQGLRANPINIALFADVTIK